MALLEKITTVEVFDPAMCCETGLCGQIEDSELAQFASDLEWLARQGIAVRRYNLAQQPEEFTQRNVVASALIDKGELCLPMIFVDGELVSEGVYPAREELLRFHPAGPE